VSTQAQTEAGNNWRRTNTKEKGALPFALKMVISQTGNKYIYFTQHEKIK